MQHSKTKPLPTEAEYFVKQLELVRSPNNLKFTRTSLRHFHRFLMQHDFKMDHLSLDLMDKFDIDLEQHGLNIVSRKTVFYNVRRYLQNLAEREIISAELIKKSFPTYKPECRKTLSANLPSEAGDFLALMASNNKSSTVNGYKATLRSFYK